MSRIRILVADSTASVRQFIKYALEDHFAGITVEMANSGKNVQQRLESTRYDLIIYEREMPFLDGDILLEWLRGHDMLGTIPFVMMSPDSNEESLKRAIKLGADAYLLKPFKAESLVNNVTTALNKLNRRKNERYRAGGTVSFRSGPSSSRGDLVDISLEGISARFPVREDLPGILKKVDVSVELDGGKMFEGLECTVIRIEALNIAANVQQVLFVVRFADIITPGKKKELVDFVSALTG